MNLSRAEPSRGERSGITENAGEPGGVNRLGNRAHQAWSAV
jgi:hypothetical protein